MTIRSRFLFGTIFLLIFLSWNQKESMLGFRPSSVDALYYNNRNECNSIQVDYAFEFTESRYLLVQDIYLRPTRTVSECFFYMNMEFNLQWAHLTISGRREPIMLEFMPTYFIGHIISGPWQANITYKLTVSATRTFRKSDTGLVFRTFRHTESLKK